jgi:hypothetical protein
VEDKTAVQPQAAGRRAAAYWFIDGLPEIFFGTLYVVSGTALLICGSHLPDRWAKAAMLGIGTAFLFLFWKDRVILDYFKMRLTYPRTGYVRPPSDYEPGGPVVLTLRAAPPVDWNVTSFRIRTVFVFWWAAIVADAPFLEGRWDIPVVMAMAAVAVYAGSRREVHPYSWWSALLIALAGLLSAGVEVPLDGRRYIPLLIGGLWLLARGVLALVRYLRTYPVPKGGGA